MRLLSVYDYDTGYLPWHSGLFNFAVVILLHEILCSNRPARQRTQSSSIRYIAWRLKTSHSSWSIWTTMFRSTGLITTKSQYYLLFAHVSICYTGPRLQKNKSTQHSHRIEDKALRWWLSARVKWTLLNLCNNFTSFVKVCFFVCDSGAQTLAAESPGNHGTLAELWWALCLATGTPSIARKSPSPRRTILRGMIKKPLAGDATRLTFVICNCY